MIHLIRFNVEVVVETEEQAKAKEAKGFKRIEVGDSAEPVETEEQAKLSDMTKSQLIALCYEKGIDIDPRAKKAELLAALSE